MREPASGGDVASRYFEALIAPLMRSQFPDLAFTAGRLGTGSDVLGFDDSRSRDHDWGLRLTLLVDDQAAVPAIAQAIDANLPVTFEELSTRFPATWDPAPAHRVEVDTTDAFVLRHLGVDAERLMEPLSWLALTGQAVLEVTAGPLFADTLGRLSTIRRQLTWYPDDVWLYVLAAAWQRLLQELPMIGRCAEVGDDLGSRVVAARLARDVMYLGHLVERLWPPYPKWLGTSFVRIPAMAATAPLLSGALAAPDWRSREQRLVEAIEAVHERQQQVGLPGLQTACEPFFDRPFQVVRAELVERLRRGITSPTVAAWPSGIGSVEQWVDSVDLLTSAGRRVQAARALAPPT